ncbi:MAG TPA: hypothetical protein VFM28_07095 [Nitrososphaeraceae archaeon]|jgi:hypothetical protein|nr:hypothetical protein [Nitrososphaeraceae archaeon]
MLKGTRISIVKKSEKNQIKWKFCKFHTMTYRSIKIIRLEFDWNNAINKMTIKGNKLISRLTKFLSISKVSRIEILV